MPISERMQNLLWKKTIADLLSGFPEEFVEPVAKAFQKRLALTENI